MSVPHLPLPCKVPTPSPMLQAFPTSLHSQLALIAIAQTMHLVSWPRPRPVPNLPPYSPFSSASTPLYTYHHHHLSRAIKEEPITFLQKKKRQHLAFKRAKINTKKGREKKQPGEALQEYPKTEAIPVFAQHQFVLDQLPFLFAHSLSIHILSVLSRCILPHCTSLHCKVCSTVYVECVWLKFCLHDKCAKK